MKSKNSKAGGAGESFRKQVSALAELVRSRLALSLLSAFLSLAIIEGIFIIILAADVMNADHTAARKLQVLRVTEEISGALQSGKKVHHDSDEAFNRPEPPCWCESYQLTYAEMYKRLLAIRQSYIGAGLDPSEMNESIASLNKLNDVMLSLKPGIVRTQEEKKTYAQTWKQVFTSILKDLRDLHKIISGAEINKLVFGSSPGQLLVAGAAINVFFLILIIFFVDHRITRPIAHLARECSRISTCELMTEPQQTSDEIGHLQKTFYDMSVLICANEKSRQNFLEILQSVQTATLQRVRSRLEPVAHLESLSERARHCCGLISETLNRLIVLLQGMTEALKSSGSKQITLHYTGTESNRLIAGALTSIDSLLSEHKIAVKSELSSESLECDEQLIVRVLVNLLSNAVKFSADGAEISFCCKRSEDGLRFSIQDSGPGISPEERNKLFKRFSQLSAADGVQRRGHGLGLSICKQIIEAHGGKIDCDSQVGQGSTFWFILPLRACPAISEKAGDKPELIKKETQSGLKLHSIKTSFALLLVIFIGTQSLLAFMLSSSYSQASQRAAVYSRKKDMLLNLQEYLAMFLLWANKMEQVKDSVENSDGELTADDLYTITNLIPSLKERMAMAVHTVKFDPGSRVANLMKVILARDIEVLKQLRLALRQASGNPSILTGTGRQVKDIMDRTDRDLFQAVCLEKEDIESAYACSATVRWQILAALSAAALLDFLLLTAIAICVLNIIHKAARLQDKAADFASGALLQRTIPGNDELSVLDKSICQVSEAIKEAQDQRQNILSVISHDLATPLSSVLTGLDMLCQGVYQSIPEPELSLLGQSEHDLKKLLQQTYDLLMIEKIDSGTIAQKKDKHDLKLLLPAGVNKFQETIEQKQIVVVEDLESLAGATVLADKRLLERCLDILLDNAIQFAPKSSSLYISGSRQDKTITITIRDTGPGISPALQDQLFERFRYLEGEPLNGLGLPLANRLSKLFEGELKIVSQQGQGTEAVLSFCQAEK